MSDNSKNRQSLLLPILIPVGSLAVIGVAVFGFSRLLLQVTPTAAWITALVAAAGIMGVTTYVAGRKAVSGGSIVSMVGAVAGIAMFAGGVAIFAAAKGEGEGPALPTVLIRALPGSATDGYAEETRAVTAPAGEPFQIEFDNMDPTMPHNVVITESEEPGAEQLFRQPPFLGPERVFWEVDPLAEGSYFFHCEVHPTTMTGTLEASKPIRVVASNLTFDTDTITLAADTPTTILFQNQDAGVQHNLSVFRDEGYTDPIVQEDPFLGPKPVTYKVPALTAGTYYFKCDVHPTTMTGTVVVEIGGGLG